MSDEEAVSRDEELEEAREQSWRSLAKKLIRPFLVQDCWGWRIQRPTLLIIDARDEAVLVVQQWRRRKPRCISDSWLLIITHFVAAACIYRKDLSRVTTSCYRLDLSLSNSIRHGLVEKINSKRKPRTCEALGQISVDHSSARRASAPIASPRHAMPRPTSPREASRATTCVFLLHTLSSA
jgi:hypothetical protein